mmetsp:Transcript_18792/g.61982  ORF Transcript_18792/g.61982 Transcript_18792/m.61982 type:complete len:278 (+) Transcript_18792:397-1230(+)
MMPLVSTSTACRCFGSSDLSFLVAFSSSLARTLSNFACSCEMAGTYCSEPCQATNSASLSRSSTSASSTFSRRRAWFLATTCLRSSTLYACTADTSLHSASTLRGTEMSMSESGRAASSSQPRSRSSAPVTMQPVAEVEVKARSHSCSDGQSSSMRPTCTSSSGCSAASSSARARPRLRSFTLVTPCEARCVSSSRDILPAPMTQTDVLSRGMPRSSGARRTASSTAALEMETAPFAICVSERTNLPAMTAELSSRPSTLPAEPAGSLSDSGAMACE